MEELMNILDSHNDFKGEKGIAGEKGIPGEPGYHGVISSMPSTKSEVNINGIELTNIRNISINYWNNSWRIGFDFDLPERLTFLIGELTMGEFKL